MLGNKETFLPIIKERFKEILKESGKTQKQLAEELDITPEHLTRCLTKGRISKPWLIAIAQCLDVSSEYLSGDEDVIFTHIAEQRAIAISNQDSILKSLFLLCGFPESEYDELSDDDKENLKTDIDLAIAYRLQNARQRKEKGE